MRKGLTPVVSVTLLTVIIISVALSFVTLIQDQQQAVTEKLDASDRIKVHSVSCNGKSLAFKLENNGTKILDTDTGDLLITDGDHINQSFTREDIDLAGSYQLPGRTSWLNLSTDTAFTSGQVYTIRLDYDAEGFAIQRDCKAGLDWWDINWDNRRQVRVSNPDPANKTGNVTFIDIDTAQEINQAQMRSNCNDIRLVENDALQDYNITDCNTASTHIFFATNVSNETTEYDAYIYYNNFQARDQSTSLGSVDRDLSTRLMGEEER